MDIKIIKDYIPIGHPNRPGRKLKDIKGIVVHWTANLRNGANALNHLSYVGRNYSRENGRFKETSGANFRYGAGQFYVDSEDIVSPIPDNEVAYHVGSSSYTQTKERLVGSSNPNNHFIGIEMCVNKDGDFNKMLDNTISLIYYLMEKYDLTVSDIYRHHDITGKYCPMFTIGKAEAYNYDLPYIKFEAFKDMIINESERFSDDSKKEEATNEEFDFFVESKLVNLQLDRSDQPIKKFEGILGFNQDGLWDDMLEKVYNQIQRRPVLWVYNDASKKYPHVVKFIQDRVGCDDIDGWYGPNTKEKVMAFQLKGNLKVDGVVGPNTWTHFLN